MKTRRSFLFVALAAVLLSYWPRASSAQVIVDQYNLDGDIFWSIHNASDIGQVWTAGSGGQLVGLELPVGQCWNPTSPLTLEILTTDAGVPQSSPVLASVAIPEISIPPQTVMPFSLVLGWVSATYVDLTGFGINLQPGTKYAFRLRTDDPPCYAIRGDTTGAYPGGQRFTNWTLQASDLVFKTFNQNSEPIPAHTPLGLALFLLAIATAAVVLLRR